MNQQLKDHIARYEEFFDKMPDFVYEHKGGVHITTELFLELFTEYITTDNNCDTYPIRVTGYIGKTKIFAIGTKNELS